MFGSLILLDNSVILCGICQNTLKDFYQPEDDDDIVSDNSGNTTIPETPEFRDDVKKMKKIAAEKNAGILAFKSVVSTKFAFFKEAIAPLLQNIKDLKKETIESIKNTEEFKNAKTIANKFRYARNSLINKYSLHYHEWRKLQLSWSKRYESPTVILQRKFRMI